MTVGLAIVPYIPLFFKGSLVTLGSWIIAALMSLLVGVIAGIMSCRYMQRHVLRRIIAWYVFIAKGIPAYVQILLAYFVIPSLLGVSVSNFTAAVGALAFCSSGYITEIIRSGINAVPQGQWDACFVVGYPLHTALVRVIMPQTFQNMLPALIGEFEQLLKSTSLLATIGITELTRTGMNIISRELNPLPIYCTIAVIYLVFSGILHGIVFYYEKRRLLWYR